MKWIAVWCLVALVFGVYLTYFRKELPYEFIVFRVGNQIMVHNKTIWNTRDLKVSFSINGKKGTATLDGKSNTAVIPVVDDVDGICRIDLSVAREDIKGMLMYTPFLYNGQFDKYKKKYIVFIGASIGRDWHLEKLTERVPGLSEVSIVFWPEYQFDKKKIIDHVLKIPVPPDLVFIKECAAYFPLDVDGGVIQVADWFHAMKKSGLKPVAVTTVPVTRKHDAEHMGRANSIMKFNEKIRSSFDVIFDLAKLLAEKNTGGKYLDSRFAQSDGLHINTTAYTLMDKKFSKFLQDIL